MAYELIETIEVGAGGAASIEFTSIPQDGVDLLLLLNLRSSYAGVSSISAIRFNAISSGYSLIELVGNGSTAYSSSASGTIFSRIVAAGDSATANTFGNTSIYIPNYSGSSNKVISVDSLTENNATSTDMRLIAGTLTNTAAITSITIPTVLNPGTEVWKQYSIASLYKITAD